MRTTKVFTIDLSHIPPRDGFQLLHIAYIRDGFIGRIMWAIDGKEQSGSVRVDFDHIDAQEDFVFLDDIPDATAQEKLNSSRHAITAAIHRHFAIR